MAFDKKKFIPKFTDEAINHIAAMNDGLLKLEKSFDHMETLDQIFRSAHTIKGSSKILSLDEVTNVAQCLENTLSSLREQKVSPSKELFSLLFKAIGMLDNIVKQIQADAIVEVDTQQICEALKRAAGGVI